MWSLWRKTASQRYALVVGNSEYDHVGKLPNPGNDAEAIAKELRKLGFKVTPCIDCDRLGLMEALKKFQEDIADAKEIVFYYAGHGLQVDGENYLVPKDADFVLKQDLFKLVPFQDVVDRLSKEDALNFFFLDACRNDPFDRTPAQVEAALRSRGLTAGDEFGDEPAVTQKGLAPVDAEFDALIGFAAAPGQTASDGEGSHSPYAQSMLLHMPTRGLEVHSVMTRVANTTRELSRRPGSKKLQVPWISTNLRAPFFFDPPSLEPVYILGLVGFISGLATAPAVFNEYGCFVGAQGIGILFGVVLGFGLWKWGGASELGGAFAAFATALSWWAAGQYIDHKLLAGRDLVTCTTGAAEFDALVGLYGAVTGLLALLGSLAAAALVSPAFRKPASWLGTILVASLMLTGVYFATINSIGFLHQFTESTSVENAARYIGVAAWYAALGGAIGFALYRYVPEARRVK